MGFKPRPPSYAGRLPAELRQRESLLAIHLQTFRLARCRGLVSDLAGFEALIEDNYPSWFEEVLYLGDGDHGLDWEFLFSVLNAAGDPVWASDLGSSDPAESYALGIYWHISGGDTDYHWLMQAPCEIDQELDSYHPDTHEALRQGHFAAVDDVSEPPTIWCYWYRDGRVNLCEATYRGLNVLGLDALDFITRFADTVQEQASSHDGPPVSAACPD